MHSLIVYFDDDVFQAILDVVANLQFQMVENLWQAFWMDSSRSSRCVKVYCTV